MLIHYNHSSVTEAERETMTVGGIFMQINALLCILVFT